MVTLVQYCIVYIARVSIPFLMFITFTQLTQLLR